MILRVATSTSKPGWVLLWEEGNEAWELEAWKWLEDHRSRMVGLKKKHVREFGLEHADSAAHLTEEIE